MGHRKRLFIRMNLWLNQNVIRNASRDLFLAFNKAKMFFMAWQNFFIMNSLHKNVVQTQP